MSRQPTLLSARLILRPFDPEDAPAVQAAAGAREIADTTLAVPHPYPDGAAAAWISTHRLIWEAGNGAVYAIVLRAGAELVGAIELSIARAHARAELGYWVATHRWNRGYCTEAARALLAFGFGPLGLHRIEARHLARNPASGRVLQKVGMQQEGVHRDAVRKWDRFEDVMSYAILATEWAASS